MKCISVYTTNFEQFSDIYEKVMTTPLAAHEEIIVDGVTVNESGEVPDHYVERLKIRPDVVVMRDKAWNATILQHKDAFEIFIPGEESMIH